MIDTTDTYQRIQRSVKVDPLLSEHVSVLYRDVVPSEGYGELILDANQEVIIDSFGIHYAAIVAAHRLEEASFSDLALSLYRAISRRLTFSDLDPEAAEYVQERIEYLAQG